MLEFFGYNWECSMEDGRIIHPDYPYMYYSESCIMIHEHGILELGMKRAPKKIKHWDGNTYEPSYACGLLRSVDTFSYGTFSAEIIMPRGVNLWPSFWLCGTGPWPESGEIDIAEGYSEDTNYFRLFTPYFPWINPSWMTTTNVHYQLNGEHKQLGSKSISIFKQKYYPDSNFLKYECKWEPEKITILIDGKVVRKDTDVVKLFKSDKVNVIFNLFCENTDPKLNTPMLIKSFNYKPLT